MFRWWTSKKSILCFGLIGSAALLAQCGPSGITVPASSSSSATSIAFVATNASFAVPVPAAAGVTGGTIGFPTTSSAPAESAKLSITVQPDVPAGFPALSGSLSDAVARRSAASASQRTIADGGLTTTTTTTTDVAAIIVTSTVSLTFPTGPVFTLDLPASSISSGESFELAYFDPVLGAWNATWAGPATVTGSALTFASNGAAFTLTANTPAVFELVVTGGSASQSPSPSATPSANASSSPSPSASATAGSLSLSSTNISLAIGGTTTQNITVSQSGVAPTFTPSLTCTPGVNSGDGTVATIAAVGSATAASAGASVTFAVSLGSPPTAGTCSGSITSSDGGTVTFSLTVTETNVSLDAKARK